MYNIDNYLIPYWSGNTMYDESAFVLEDENGRHFADQSFI